MYPVLFELFGLKIYAYGVLVAIAFLLGFVFIGFRARQHQQNPEVYQEALIWFILSGIGGARLFYFLWYPQFFLENPFAALVSQGGLVWYGGVLGVLLASMVYTRIKKLNWLLFGDIITPACALGLAIGRIGCLLAGCCYGAPGHLPWAIHYPRHHETSGVGVHPAPLYETGSMLLVLVLLLRLDAKKPFNGFIMACFFILAGIVRFALEYSRGDRLIWLSSLDISASQAVSLLGILFGCLLLLYSKKVASPTA
jgi:phosphatidylglycerol---prolipoprotein diacylglyceryl transferase